MVFNYTELNIGSPQNLERAGVIYVNEFCKIVQLSLHVSQISDH